MLGQRRRRRWANIKPTLSERRAYGWVFCEINSHLKMIENARKYVYANIMNMG